MASVSMATTVDRESPRRRVLANVLVPLYLTLIYGLPLAFLATPMVVGWIGIGIAVLAPLGFVSVAGGLARIHSGKVVEGRFAVDTGIQSYFHRRMYGLCWTAIYYSGPLYYLILAMPWFKAFTFRLFGYQGCLNFTIYPDTWIRDLPLLDFGAGCYISNKATIGSNMIFFRNGQKVIEVGRITIGQRSLVGHLTAIGPSTVIGDDAQIGVTTSVGRRVIIGDNVVISDCVALDHGATVESGACVPTRAYVAGGVRITSEDRLERGQVVRRVPRHKSIERLLIES